MDWIIVGIKGNNFEHSDFERKFQLKFTIDCKRKINLSDNV